MLEKIKFPNTHCPHREQCMKSKTRWMVCKLRKEYISHIADKLREQKIKKGSEPTPSIKDEVFRIFG